uniref:Major tropism determinant N-terminal domain-containing protein n=1 Tax=viral metagenome TaxID=1070528 RepID=A0A6H1ZZR4_9ZZZZ
MGDTILLRRGTAANLPDLQEGEPGFATDNEGFYIGDDTGTAESAAYIGGGVYVDALQYEPNTYTQATIEAALTAIGTVNKKTLLLRPGTWVISSNADWSAYTNVVFRIVPGAKFSGAFTLNIPNIDAGLYQIFDSTVGAVTFSGAVKNVYPEWFGAVGDKTTNDIAALDAAVVATAAYRTLWLTKSYRIASQWAFTKAINISGPGIIWLDVGTAVDGVVVGTEELPITSAATFIEGIRWDFGGIFGAQNSCKNALVLKQVNRSHFDIPVKAGTVATTGYAVWLQWGIVNYYRFIISTNIAYGYGEYANNAANGIRMDTSTGVATASNINLFDLVIEGGAAKGLYIFTSGDNGNNEIRGTYAVFTGYGIHLKGAKAAHLHDIHLETATANGELVIEDSTHVVLGNNVSVVNDADPDVLIINSGQTIINGLRAQSLSIDANSSDTKIIDLTRTKDLTDLGKRTVQVTTRTKHASVVSERTAPFSDFNSLTTNGDVERWTTTATRPPGSWSYIGGNPTWERESSIVKHGTYSAKITNSAVNQAVMNLATVAQTTSLPTDAAITASGWIYIPTASGGDVSIIVVWNVGTSPIKVITSRDTWTYVSFSYYARGVSADQTLSDLKFQTAGATIMYLDGWSAVPSGTGGSVLYTPRANEFPAYTGQATWDPASIAASGYLAQDFVCPGAALGMVASVGAGVDVTDLVVSATVTAANTVTVTLFNPTVGAIDLASSTWNIMVINPFP